MFDDFDLISAKEMRDRQKELQDRDEIVKKIIMSSSVHESLFVIHRNFVSEKPSNKAIVLEPSISMNVPPLNI